MKEFLARLNPTERRFVVGVAVLFFLVINIVWVWPHFGDWSETSHRRDDARNKLLLFQTGTNLIPDLQKKIAKFQGQGEIVPSMDQAVRFVRLILNETAASGIVAESMTPQRSNDSTNNPFYVEQSETMTLQTTEKQLVDFLFSLGSGTNSLIRVKSLSVQPDPSHQRLTTRLTVVASYQKQAIGASAERRAAPTTTATTPAVPGAAPGAPPSRLPPTNRALPGQLGASNSLPPIKK